MRSSRVHKTFMSWYQSKKVSAFPTDVQAEEGTPPPPPVLRPGHQAFRSDGCEHERRAASVLRPSLLNITASLHAAAPSVAQRTVTFHFLQTVKMALERGGVGTCLFALFKGNPTFSIALLNPRQQTNALFGPSDPITGLCAQLEFLTFMNK